MTMKTVAPETRSEREEERILRWRFDRLREAGFADADAAELAARRDVDLHHATDLMRRGCPAGTALRILH